MKLLREYIRLLMSESTEPVKAVENVGGKEIISSTFSLPGGKIKVWENSPYAGGAHSIMDFVVDESQRGQGIGSQLIDAVIQAYPGEELSGQVSSLASLKVLFNKGQAYPGEELSGQVSSLASLKVLFNKGFRPHGPPPSDFNELVEMFNDEGGSLNMRSS